MCWPPAAILKFNGGALIGNHADIAEASARNVSLPRLLVRKETQHHKVVADTNIISVAANERVGSETRFRYKRYLIRIDRYVVGNVACRDIVRVWNEVPVEPTILFNLPRRPILRV